MKNLGTLTWLVSGRARGGRSRLIGTAAGLAIGTMLLLLVFAAYQGMTDRTARADVYAQLGYGGMTPEAREGISQETLLEESQADTYLSANEFLTPGTSFMGSYDRFQDQRITRLDVAATEGSTAKLPGIKSLPGPGEYYASPALAELISQYPQDQLGARYGSIAGVIGDDGLMGPDTLLVVIGHDPLTLVQEGGVVIVNSDELVGESYPNANYMIIALIGGLAILFPVVVLISIVTKLGQAARADRFRSLGLIGATPQRIATMSTLETVVVGAIGTLAGIALYWLSLPIVARLKIGESRFFVSDLILNASGIATAAVLIIVSTTITAFFSALRSQRGALSTARETPEKRPSVWRMTPLVLGIALLLAPIVTNQFATASDFNEGSNFSRFIFQFLNLALIPGFLLVAFGLVLAGPLVLSWTARFAAHRAKSTEGVLALNRLLRRPSATFRTVSGLVLALFVVTVFAVALTTDQTEQSQVQAFAASPDRVSIDAFITDVTPDLAWDAGQWNAKESAAAIDSANAVAERSAKVAGVTGAYVAYVEPSDTDHARYLLRTADALALGIDTPSDSGFVSVNSDYLLYSTVPQQSIKVDVKAVPEGLPPLTSPVVMVVQTDGTSAAQERVRTALTLGPFSHTLSYGSPPQTQSEQMQGNGTLSWAQQYAGLANIGIVIAALISVVSLAISTVAGVLERRRALALLRLTGMPATKLRHMITLETAVPFASTFFLCIGIGVFTAWAVITGVNPNRTVTWPDPGYYIAVAFCLVFAALAVLATFRTVGRSTSLTETRFE